MFFKKSNRKYGTNFIPPINTPPPDTPPNQYGNGSYGSIDNSELDVLLGDDMAIETEKRMIADIVKKNIKGVNNMEEEKSLKPIKEIVLIDSKNSIKVGEFIYLGINQIVKEIKPTYDNSGALYLYNLIGESGNILASVQSNNTIIKYKEDKKTLCDELNISEKQLANEIIRKTCGLKLDNAQKATEDILKKYCQGWYDAKINSNPLSSKIHVEYVNEELGKREFDITIE